MLCLSKFIACLSLVSLAAIPVVRGAQIDVTVGGTGILKFTPDTVNANVGDVVVFTFMQKNHTVTQSSLANPCQPLDQGFDSGFVPVPADNTNGPFPQAELTISDTKPIWAYCQQANHCQQGMVFSVNPGDKLDTFRANAVGAAAAAEGASTSAPADASTTAPTATTATASSIPTSTDHKVVVGGPGMLIFTPSTITAQPGDTITFEFHQVNHTVTQSSFANPCRPLGDTTSAPGFNSGFMAVASGATTFPTYVVQVNNTTPIWAFCAQTSHCGKGMVFAANVDPSSANTFDAFVAKAEAINGTGSSSGGGSSPGGSYGGGSSSSSGSGRSTSSSAALLVVAGALALGSMLS